MSLRSGTLTKKSTDVLERRVPKSTKYDKVEATINSGPTIDKFYAKHSQAELNSRFKRNTSKEYKRIRLNTLAKWIETAMIVLAQPDFLESKESIYSLDEGPALYRRPDSVNSSTAMVSMADTEASVVGDEPGCPPMFTGGSDCAAILRGDNTPLVASDATVTSYNDAALKYQALQGELAVQQSSAAPGPRDRRAAHDGSGVASLLSGTNTQLLRQQELIESVEDSKLLRTATRERNQTSSVAVNNPRAPSTLEDIQLLTTRARHNKVLERIHLLPNIKLEVFKNAKADNMRTRYIAMPMATKQFAVLDMRASEDDFRSRHIWGSVWLPIARLHRATNKMPVDLHYFVKFDESIVVLVGLSGPELDDSVRLLEEYGLARRNITLLIQSLGEVEKECPSIIVRADNLHHAEH